MSLVLALDLVHLEVSLASCENSDAFGQCSLDLLVELVDGDVVYEFLNRALVLLAFEDRANLDADEYVVVGWARLHRQLEHHVLLGHQVLDLGLLKM